MRLHIQPLMGKFRTLEDCSVKFCPGTTKRIQDMKPNIQTDLLNPGYLRVPAGTIFFIKRVHLSAYHDEFSVSCPIKLNDRKNPWCGLSKYFTTANFEDFNIEVEKLS